MWVDDGYSHKEGPSLVWDPSGKFIEQSWTELKPRIHRTQGGVGIVADDFAELLRYRPAPFRDQVPIFRDHFANLVRNATSPEDIELLSHVLNYILIEPWRSNLEGAWFVYYIEQLDSRDIDATRAVAIVNRLHDKSPDAAVILCQTLSTYWHGPDRKLVIDTLLETGLFTSGLIKAIKAVHLNRPSNGQRQFIEYHPFFLSYSHADAEIARRMRARLSTIGLTGWTDEMIRPGTEQWQMAVESAIRDCGAMVVLLTPAARDSQWVRKELQYGSIFNKRIVPVLAAGDEAAAVPIDVATMQRIDLRLDFDRGLAELASVLRQHL